MANRILDDTSKQILLLNDTLELHVSRSRRLVRIVLYLLTLVSALFPLLIIVIVVINGDGFRFGNFISIGASGFTTFYLLRASLWNTYGREVLIFNEHSFIYESDYKWFKTKQVEIEFNTLDFSKVSVGYEEEDKWNLVVNHDSGAFKCTTNLPGYELDDLIRKLNKNFSRLSE